MSQSWDRVGSQSPAKTGNEWAGGGGGREGNQGIRRDSNEGFVMKRSGVDSKYNRK